MKKNKEFSDLIGQQYGFYKILEEVDPRNYHRRFLCECICGNKRVKFLIDLKSGHNKSCGCYQKKFPNRKTHGLRKSSVYNSWSNMKQRCLNPKSTRFENWGGRGITICTRWLSFENFYADMGEKPSPKYEIDRIDNNGNYEPGNCRWVLPKENSSNRRKRKSNKK